MNNLLQTLIKSGKTIKPPGVNLNLLVYSYSTKSIPNEVDLVEVGPRDGLQNEKVLKTRIINEGLCDLIRRCIISELIGIFSCHFYI